MTTRRFPGLGVLLGLTAILAGARGPLVGASPAGRPQAAPVQAALKIVVIEGENAVNVIQQKTAVAPVIEVRDRNDQPVAGAVVRFAIRSGRATFNGARTLSVTTNAAGRAVVTGLTPTGSGALQISASAAFQGQTAAVTIAQTNVLTAAQAATASAGASGAGGGAGASGAGGAGGAGGGAGAGAGGASAGGAGAGGAATGGAAAGGAAAGGATAAGAGAATAGAGAGAAGGFSAATVAIVGGAAAGGTFALKEAGVVGGGGQKFDVYVGQISGIIRQAPDGGGCFRDDLHSGEMVMELQVSDTGVVTGTVDVNATNAYQGGTCGATSTAPEPFGCCDKPPQVAGTTSSFGFNASNPGNPGVTVTFAFTGSLSGTTVTGTYTLTVRSVSPTNGSGFGGTKNFPVTLTKQQ